MTNPNPNTPRSRTFRVTFDITINHNDDTSYGNRVDVWAFDAIQENLEQGEEITAWECKEVPTPPSAEQLWFDNSWQESQDDGA